MDKFLDLLIPFAVIGAIGAFFGLMLGIAAKFWKIPKDGRIDRILGHLPGANCGGCGYSGCKEFAKAIVKGEASCNGCNVCSQEDLDGISDIMGVASSNNVPSVCTVACRASGAEKRHEFEGALDCLSVAKLGGDKLCPYSCIGLGSCVAVCKFDAITLKDSVATVDNEKCTACGACVRTCPKGILRIQPKGSVAVACSSRDGGKRVGAYCKNGCIACRICENVCEAGAIKLVGNLPVIDAAKCTDCGKCIEKCPKGVLVRA